MAAESSFANYVAARGRSALVEENRFAADVVREPDSRADSSSIHPQRAYQT
jgi:hypothetical protein